MITELTVKIVARYNINNLWLFHVFAIIEYGFWATVFSFWQKGNQLQILLRASILIFISIWLINLIFNIERFNDYNNVSRSIESNLLTADAVFTIYNSYLESNIVIYKNYIFWFSIGVLVYFSGNFMIFLLGKFTINVLDVGIIHSVKLKK